LAIDPGRQLTLEETALVRDAFSDSELPYKLDLVYWHDIDDRWRRKIATECAALTEPARPASRHI